jgi:starch synthase
VLVGSGDPHYEWWVGDLQRRFPGLVGNWVGYREDLAHLVYAGSDLYLMPSLFEPCGLSQMYAMRYGTLPVVRRTGGLADTVWNYVESDGGGDGFVFDDYRVDALYYTLGWAVSTYFDRHRTSNHAPAGDVQGLFLGRVRTALRGGLPHALRKVRG